MEKIILFFQKKIILNYRIVIRFIEKTPLWLIILIILNFLYLSFVPNENEEQYLQLAKLFMDSDWIYNSRNLQELPGSRIIYQLILGFVLKFLSFETTVFLFRFLLIVIYSFILSKIFLKLRVYKVTSIFSLVLFTTFFQQNLFAGSWMFISVEAKCFSYLFVLLAIYKIQTDKLNLALLYLVIATYIHVLVGGYAFIYLFLTFFLFKKSYNITVKSLFYILATYSGLVSFFVFYLIKSLKYTKTNANVSPDWIYTYFRSPHHTALVPSFEYFYQNHFFGILLAIILLLISITLYKEKKDSFQFIHQFIIISLFGTLLLVPLAFIDKTGTFLKFYPYRINTLTTFFLLINLVDKGIKYITKDGLKYFKGSLLLLTFYLLISPLILNFRQNFGYLRFKETPLSNICKYIKKNTKREALIFSFVNDVSITRRTERNLFTVEKFIPAEVGKINQWYLNQKLKNKILKNPEKIDLLVERQNIDYILCKNDLEISNKFTLTYKNKYLSLYKSNK